MTVEYFAEGDVHEKTFSSFDDERIGQTIDIYYNKNNPYEITMYKKDVMFGLFLTCAGLLLMLVCKKAAKGYFTDFLLEHRILLFITSLHIVIFLIWGLGWALDELGLIIFIYAEYLLVPANIIALVIAALDEREEKYGGGRKIMTEDKTYTKPREG